MSPRCPRMQRWGERGHTPRRVPQRGRRCEATSGLVDPEWAVALRSALPAGHCQRDTLPAPVGARIRHRRREAGDITQLPVVPKAREAPPRGHRPPTPPGAREGTAAWAGDAAPTLLPPSLPTWGSPGPRSPHLARAAQVQSRNSSPYLLLGPDCCASIDPPGGQRQGSQQQQQVAGAQDARVPDACHLSEDV